MKLYFLVNRDIQHVYGYYHSIDELMAVNSIYFSNSSDGVWYIHYKDKKESIRWRYTDDYNTDEILKDLRLNLKKLLYNNFRLSIYKGE